MERHIAVQDHLGGLKANGAICAVHDGLGRAQDGLHIFLAAVAVQQTV